MSVRLGNLEFFFSEHLSENFIILENSKSSQRIDFSLFVADEMEKKNFKLNFIIIF